MHRYIHKCIVSEYSLYNLYSRVIAGRSTMKGRCTCPYWKKRKSNQFLPSDYWTVTKDLVVILIHLLRMGWQFTFQLWSYDKILQNVRDSHNFLQSCNPKKPSTVFSVWPSPSWNTRPQPQHPESTKRMGGSKPQKWEVWNPQSHGGGWFRCLEPFG